VGSEARTAADFARGGGFLRQGCRHDEIRREDGEVRGERGNGGVGLRFGEDVEGDVRAVGAAAVSGSEVLPVDAGSG